MRRLVLALLATSALTSTAWAQGRQPAQITTTPTATPQSFDILDKTGAWVPLGVMNGGAFVLASGPTADTNATLTALPSSIGAVTRRGYLRLGDSPATLYVASTGPCGLNSGAGDGGSQVPASDGKCWIGKFPDGEYNILSWGADPVGTADSTAALRAVLAYAASNANPGGGGTVVVPFGFYGLDPTAGPIAMTGNKVTLECRGGYTGSTGAQFIERTDAGDLFTMSGSWLKIKGCGFNASTRILTSGYQVRAKFPCAYCSMENVNFSFVYRAVALGNVGDFTIDRMNAQYLLSPVAVYMGGQPDNLGGHATVAPRISHLVTNDPSPSTLFPSYRITWAQSLAVTLGQWIFQNGNLYQATQAGTTASTGTGPSGYPAGVTSPNLLWTTPIVDGTVQWKFVTSCPATSDGTVAWVVQDSWAYTVRLDHMELLGGCHGFSMIDTQTSGGNGQPLFSEHNDVELERNLFDDMYLRYGGAVQAVNGYASVSLTGSGINVLPNFTSAMFSNMLINNNAQHGLYLRMSNAMPNRAFSLTNSQLYFNSNSPASDPIVYNNVHVSAGNVSNFSITNNFVGPVAAPGASPSTNTGWGVYVYPAASDYYVITGNICGGANVNGCVQDNGTGTHKTVSGNW